MADLADVEVALVSIIAETLYPGGILSPIIPVDCRIYRGWPLPAGLNADLADNIVNVTVFPSPAVGRTLPALPISYVTEEAADMFTASTSLAGITFAGTPSPRHCAGLMVDGAAYAYRPRESESASAVAAELAAMIAKDRVVHLSGTTVTVPNSHKVIARVVGDQTSWREVRRQEREFVVAAWCPTPSLRDDVSKAIDTVLAELIFLPLADQSSGRIRYASSSEFDQAQAANLYRRDLIYTIEYPTVTRHDEPAMLFGSLELNEIARFN